MQQRHKIYFSFRCDPRTKYTLDIDVNGRASIRLVKDLITLKMGIKDDSCGLRIFAADNTLLTDSVYISTETYVTVERYPLDDAEREEAYLRNRNIFNILSSTQGSADEVEPADFLDLEGKNIDEGAGGLDRIKASFLKYQLSQINERFFDGEYYLQLRAVHGGLNDEENITITMQPTVGVTNRGNEKHREIVQEENEDEQDEAQETALRTSSSVADALRAFRGIRDGVSGELYGGIEPRKKKADRKY